MNAAAAAEHLDSARRDAREVEPLTDEIELTEANGYEYQNALLELELGRGAKLVGRKLGLTSRAKQVAIGIDSPIHGFLLDRMVHVENTLLSLDGLIHPRIEPEIAFRLSGDLSGDVTVDDVLAATAAVVPAFEVIDSRYRDFRFKLPDVLADNTSAALVIAPEDGVVPGEIDLELEAVVLSVDGTVVETATGAAVLGNPAAALAWLASQRPLRAGDLVLSGGLTNAVPLAPGMRVTAEFAQLGTLSVEVGS